MLMKLMLVNSTLFEGVMGTIEMDPVFLELTTNNDGLKPYSGRAYPIPHIHYNTTKNEINRLVKIGVLRQCSTKDNPEWGAPTFIIPKKGGRCSSCDGFSTTQQNVESKTVSNTEYSELITVIKRS
jgi:hypothetical protein